MPLYREILKLHDGLTMLLKRLLNNLHATLCVDFVKKKALCDNHLQQSAKLSISRTIDVITCNWSKSAYQAFSHSHIYTKVHMIES